MSIKQLSTKQYNNFNLVRLLAALMVMAGHMGTIMGNEPPTFGSQELQNIGVQVLFIMGGYLVANSWKNDPHICRFLIRRFLRLWPPYAVMILLMCFVAGPILSDLGVAGYFGSWWYAYLMNLRFYIVFAQPGVFTTNPIALVTNGSLWTMPVEALMYLLTPVIMILVTWIGQEIHSKSNFKTMVFVTMLFCIPNIVFGWDKSRNVLFYGTNWIWAYVLIVFYVIGILCSFDEMKSIFHLQVTPIVVFIILLTNNFRYPHSQQAVWMFALPYLVFSVALTEKPMFSRIGTRYDLAYGIYLYGFFFQQLVVYVNLRYEYNWSYMVCFLISLALTSMIAFVNCVLIEKPLQRLNKRIMKVWKIK